MTAPKLPVKLEMINQTEVKKIAKLYLIFQKLDHLPCNKILELV